MQTLKSLSPKLWLMAQSPAPWPSKYSPPARLPMRPTPHGGGYFDLAKHSKYATSGPILI